MKAMILAAGRGERLKPITNIIPKCMIPINGIPILEYNICYLQSFDIKNIVINLHHLQEVVTNYFNGGKNWNVNITYSVENELLGTSGAVKNASGYFNEPFLLLYGDNITNCDIDELKYMHKKHGGIGTIGVFPRAGSSGIVNSDEQNRVTSFNEKKTNYVFAGIAILEPEIMKYIPDGFSDFGRDIFPKLKNLYSYNIDKLWWIDTLDDLENTQKDLKHLCKCTIGKYGR